MEDKRKIIAERIKERRLALKLTQKELASALNVTFQTISKYETCINIPDAETLNKLSELLQCSSDYLLGKTNDIDIYMSKNNDVILKISEDCEYYLTPNEVETMVKYLKSTNYNVDKLINDIKTGIIK